MGKVGILEFDGFRVFYFMPKSSASGTGTRHKVQGARLRILDL